MKIYFAGSIRGGRQDAEIYAQIIDFLQDYGEVLTEHVGSNELMDKGELNLTDREIHNRDMGWLMESDVIVAEVTNPSLGVGYEIGRAIEAGKLIICLYRESSDKKLSAMVSGSKNINTLKYCDFQEIKKDLEKYFKNKKIRNMN